MENTVNSRIKHILDSVFNGNVTEMAKATFIRRTTINSIIGEQQSLPGYEVIKKLGEIKSNPISLDWLIYGTGEMLVENKEKPTVQTVAANAVAASAIGVNYAASDATAALIAQLQEKDRQIEKLLNLLSK